jgi:2-amino-4-hydroxy-6-hydroxymethyldihydropteridine diphosphokinase
MMKPREPVFVALGSNLGMREDHLAFARQALADLPGTEVRSVSSVEETEPIGPIDQDAYLNQMVLLETTMAPEQLLEGCLAIEARRGRVRGERWGPRVLDIDIVQFGDRVVATERLTIPHPEIANRAFWQREIAELDS